MWVSMNVTRQGSAKKRNQFEAQRSPERKMVRERRAPKTVGMRGCERAEKEVRSALLKK